ncbi:MAG TPA: ACP S-malonyltransferase [Steroidobacteraceae bacterium]|nr:ACP S-malonyltransferase [Steroidobacteraceae bacterium]
MSRAFVFPGQGSQSVGMLAEFAAADSLVIETYAEASAILGYDLWQLVSQGPAESLNETRHQQPAMLAADIATWRLWRKAGGVVPDVVCGHSLGEFSALVAAGAITFRDAVDVVSTRAALMQEAVPAGVGAMAAVLGLDDADVAAACQLAAQGEIVEPVNFNSPGQVVIAGHATAVARAIEQCKVKGAKRAVHLPMTVPSHSSLMQPAAQAFGKRLAALDIKPPAIAFWSPVDAARHTDPADIRALLQRQLASAVRWSELVRTLLAQGSRDLIECGPGKVLTSLNRRIDKDPSIRCLALQDPVSLAAALATLAGPT